MSRDTANYNLQGWAQSREHHRLFHAMEFAKLLLGNIKQGFEPDWQFDNQRQDFMLWCKVCGV